ncbi:MAG: nicotinate-nucleotide adenylyltransferase [Lachnospiraceae bacterium]|nr:nicotinate-nucleotide adenylyltransferase [Lachnospiraceae bacterium]
MKTSPIGFGRKVVMDAKKKIGIFGGTFDPPHRAHLVMAENAYKALQLDEVWFMPNNIPAYKVSDHEIASAKNRTEMLTMLVKDKEWGKVSTIELERDGNTYTSDTLTILTEDYPEYEFYLVIGSDSLMSMHWWHEVATIFKLANIVVLCRGTDTKEELTEEVKKLRNQYDGNVILIENEVMDISSSEIRVILSDKENDRSVIEEKLMEKLPSDIVSYIYDNELYGT